MINKLYQMGVAAAAALLLSPGVLMAQNPFGSTSEDLIEDPFAEMEKNIKKNDPPAQDGEKSATAAPAGDPISHDTPKEGKKQAVNPDNAEEYLEYIYQRSAEKFQKQKNDLREKFLAALQKEQDKYSKAGNFEMVEAIQKLLSEID